MRTMDLSLIDENIKKNRKQVNKAIAKQKLNKPLIKRQSIKSIVKRSEDEIKMLTLITKATIVKATKDGKFVFDPEKRVLTYDPRD